MRQPLAPGALAACLPTVDALLESRDVAVEEGRRESRLVACLDEAGRRGELLQERVDVALDADLGSDDAGEILGDALVGGLTHAALPPVGGKEVQGLVQLRAEVGALLVDVDGSSRLVLKCAHALLLEERASLVLARERLPGVGVD